jgi:hypothetical protein
MSGKWYCVYANKMQDLINVHVINFALQDFCNVVGDDLYQTRKLHKIQHRHYFRIN